MPRISPMHVSAVLRGGRGRADAGKGEKETERQFGNTESSTFGANAFIQEFDQILPVKALCFYSKKKICKGILSLRLGKHIFRKTVTM